jgi:hypothetical protein
MRKEVAEIWSKALRSGEFVQGIGYLDKKQSQCPLGILCLLALTVGVCEVAAIKNAFAYDNQLARLPESVKEWAKMYGQNGEMRGEFVNLTWYNDVGEYTLEEIADLIDERWERL